MTPVADLLERWPLRVPDGGKDDSGTVAVIGGPPTCPGAALLCATAALRVGSGRVQVVVHPEVQAGAALSGWELFVTGWDQVGPMPADVAEVLAEADAVVLGPGHRSLEAEVVEAVVGASAAHVVLDAGALAVTASLRDRRRLVLAPNPSEASTIVGEEADLETMAGAIAELTRNPAAVRGATTVISDGGGCWSFDDAPPGLGTPGSGDVMIGTLAGLLANGNEPLAALAWATVLHAEAGRELALVSPVGYLASELLDALPVAVAAHLSDRTRR